MSKDMQAILSSLSRSNNQISTNMLKLSTNKAINSSKDGSSSCAKVKMLESDIACNKKASVNMSQAMAVLSTTEAGLDSVSNILVRMKELAIEFGGAQTQQEKDILAKEFINSKNTINNISSAAKFGDNSVMMAKYTNTTATAKVGSALSGHGITFNERTGPSITPVEFAYNAEDHNFSFVSLDGERNTYTVPYLSNKSEYLCQELGINFTVDQSSFNSADSINVSDGKVSSVGDIFVGKEAGKHIGTMTNVKIIKSTGGLDAVLNADTFKEMSVLGTAADATVKLGASFTAGNVDFSQGSHTDKRLVLTSLVNPDAYVVVSYDWTLTDVNRLNVDGAVVFGADNSYSANPTLNALDYVTDYERQNESTINMTFQSGIGYTHENQISITYDSVDTSQLGVQDLDLNESYITAIKNVESAISSIIERRSDIGTTMKNIQSTQETINNTVDQYTNTMESINHVDTSALSYELAKEKASVQMTISLIGQMNEKQAEMTSLVR